MVCNSCGTGSRTSPDKATTLSHTLLTQKEVAQKLRVSEAWVKDHCTRSHPRLPHVKFGKGQRAVRRFVLSQIEQYIQDHLVGERRVISE